MEFVFIATILLCCGGLFLLTTRAVFDASGIYIIHVLSLMIPPAVMHVFDFTLPGTFYEAIVEHRAILKLALVVVVSFLGVILGFIAFRRMPIGQALFPAYSYEHSHIMIVVDVLILTLISVSVLMVPLSYTGFNIAQTADLIRHDFFFAGAAYLKQFQFFANFISGGYLVYLLKRRKEGVNVRALTLVLMVLLFVVNMFSSTLMGGKTMIVFPLAFTFMAYEICVARRGYLRMVLGGVLIVAVVVGLQFTRSAVVQNVDKSASEHMYVGLYWVLYDSTLVYLDTHQDLHHTTLGQDFVNGVSAVVPRAIWKSKPTQHITVGSRFKAQLTQGQGQGGWPVYGAAQWYTNFGWPGVFLGGVLTGWLLALLQRKYSDYSENPFSFMILWNVVFLVMGPWPGGVHSFFLSHYVLFIVPLFIFKWMTKKSVLNIS